MFGQGRILVIDDEPLVLEMFESVFARHGYEVSLASNAREALFQLERSFYDAIVTDVLMEGIDGFAVLAIARSKNPEVGVVLVTGAPSEGDARRASDQRASYLSKPVGFDRLLETVKLAIQKAKPVGAQV